jgi:integrase
VTSIFRREGRKGYTIEYRDPTTLRLRQRSFPTKTEAQLYGDELREKARAAAGLGADSNFAEYAVAWLKATRTAVRHGTDKNYSWAVRRHLVPALGTLTLRTITAKHVRDLIVKLRGRFARNTVATIRGTLHAILEAAVEERVLPSNPARFRSKSKLMRLSSTPGEDRAAVKALDAGQVRAFFAAAPAAAPRHHVLFRLMVLTGLRPGEALGLQPGDLEYREGRIRLERAITPQQRVEPCKTSADGGFEYVDVPPALAEELRHWLARMAQEALAAGRAMEWVFPLADGRHGRHKLLGAAFLRVLKAAGLPVHFTPHCLRHTFATQHLIRGESVYYVSRQLRHTDIRMTVARYGSWLPAGNRAASQRLESALFGVSALSDSQRER